MINIKTNSTKVENGDTFVAIKGHTVDGHNFIDDAIKNGAKNLIVEKEGNYSIPYLVVDDTKKYLDDVLKENYSKDFEKLKIIGITGTNGKTTTAYITSSILTKLNIKNAYIGTIGFYINSKKIKDLPNTTPDILELYNLIYDAKNEGCEVIVMEISSHSLDLNRINGINFAIAAFTNLTQDHLDYHKNMENYLNSKRKILSYIDNKGIIVVNKDDKYSEYFINGNAKTIGVNDCDYNIDSYSFDLYNSIIEFTHNKIKYNVKTNLFSKFNVYNYLTSLAIVNNLGINIDDIIKVTKDIYAPKGRFEAYKVKEGLAIIDYAHTPDAVLKIITAVKEHAKGKIITVIGCGGNRDKLKRPIMGEIATKNSDYVIFTNDNPRLEDEKNIMNDIIKGVIDNNYEIEYDRKIAIKKALDLIGKNDIALILGKGHEEYQIFKNGTVYFSDSKEVIEYNIT